MTALAIVEPQAGLSTWWDQGRDLYAQRRELDWQLADWISTGVQSFGEQACFQFAAEQLQVEPQSLRSCLKVASAFPASQRATDVPFEVHAYIAQLPADRRLATLQRASSEHWKVRDAKRVVVEHRQEVAMFDDDDPEVRLAVEIFRAWNRAPREAREYAGPRLLRAIRTMAAINEDEVIDA